MKFLFEQMIQKLTQTTGARNEIDQILTPILAIQGIYGYQILDSNWSWRNNFPSHICFFTLTAYTSIGTYEFLKNNDEFVLFAEALFSFVIFFSVPIKFLFFVYYRSTFRNIYVMAKTLLLDIIVTIAPEKGTQLTNMVKKMVKGIFVMAITPLLTYILIALWSYLHGTRANISRTTSIMMPMTSPYYEIGLILHSKYLFMAGILIIVTDFWFVFLTYFLCEACGCATKILQVKKKRGETYLAYSNRLNEALRKFYFVHVKLVKYLNTMNYVYKWPLLVPFTTVLMITCLFLLIISEEFNWQITTAIMPSTVQIFAYNIFGEAVKSKMSDMKMALINFDWLSLKLKDRRNYYIIICYMTKEFGIRTVVGIDLSLLTLSNLYKGSYQFYAVLNSMKS